MLKYLYAQQKSKLIFFVVFSLLSSLFEIALSFVMLQSVNLAMDGNLSDALNDGLWFGLYIFCYFIVDLICRRLRWSVIQGRASRGEYWKFSGTAMMLFSVLGLFGLFIPYTGFILMILCELALFLPFLCLSVRRSY